MKERIVFKTESSIKGRKEIAKINEYVNNFNFDCAFERKVEQVPESFEELKELIKQKVKEDNHNGIKKGFGSIEYILIDDKSFLPTGEILDEDNDVFAIIRNPARMWQIIKSLIGEE